MIYYQVYHTILSGETDADGIDYKGRCEVVLFYNLDEAIQFADENGCTIIEQIGGNWSDFERCTFCGEWWESCELNKDGECAYCEQAIKSHGGI